MNLKNRLKSKKTIISKIELCNKETPYEEIFSLVSFGTISIFPFDILNQMFSHQIRKELVLKYSWAVPCKEATDAISEFSPLIEIGAGTGYWAMQIKKNGADIVAFDKKLRKNLFFDVRYGNEKEVKKHRDRTLFLCWPPYDDAMAYRCLKQYQGQYFIYVGEMGGCTGDDRFQKLLDKNFEIMKQILIPQWHGIFDAVFVMKRRKI